MTARLVNETIARGTPRTAPELSDPIHAARIMPGMDQADDLHSHEFFDAIPHRDPLCAALAAHWHGFRAFLSVTLLCFGAPRALYENLSILRTDRNEMFGWLRALESIARRLLLIAAAQDRSPIAVLPPRRFRGPAKGVTAMGDERRVYDFVNPSKIRAEFKIAPPPSRDAPVASQRGPACGAEARPFFHLAPFHLSNAAPLAARLEALIRVYKDPASYVTRLRQMLAQQQGRFKQTLCRRIAQPPARTPPSFKDGVEDLNEETACAIAAAFRPPR
jgi:hypothetical protein